jgi:hypothetical protein
VYGINFQVSTTEVQVKVSSFRYCTDIFIFNVLTVGNKQLNWVLFKSIYQLILLEQIFILRTQNQRIMPELSAERSSALSS